jgi:DNA polymerase III subunit gamma/tau
MSRCQRFDFKRIPPGMIFDQIMNIAKIEKIDIDDKAAILISRAADGSLRDALVVFDQMVSFSDKKINAEDVMELLGMVHKDKVFDISGAVIDCDSKQVAAVLDELINNGKDPVFIANNLLAFYRDLMILKTLGEPSRDMAFTEDELKKMNEEKDKVSLEEILYILQNISQSILMMKGTMSTRAPLEITLIKLTKRQAVLSLPEIMRRLEALESGTGNREQGASARPSLRGAEGDEAISVDQRPKTEDQRPKTEDQRPKTEDRRPMTDNRQPITDNLSPVSVPATTHAHQLPENDTAKWDLFLKHVKTKKMSVYTFLTHGKPVEFNEESLIIGFGEDHKFNKEVLEVEDNKRLLQGIAKELTGSTPKLEFKILDFLGKKADKKLEEKQKIKEKTRNKLNPVIEKAMDVFGGQVIRDVAEENA